MKQTIARTTALLASCTLLITACSGNTSTNTSTNNNGTNTATTTSTTTGISGPIPIGIAFAQTSNVALLGQEGVAGAKIAEKYFNDKMLVVMKREQLTLFKL
jgi:branched-chain amino acid transport system substrate-binding protein